MPDWEQHYLDGHTPWDKGEAAPSLVDWMAAHPGGLSGRVLVPGCGLGHDVRAIAAASPKTDAVGLDISPTAVERARALPAFSTERYRQGDLFDLPEGMLDAFDWVWEHTCFCAIDPDRRDDYVRAARAALRKGGQFLGVFYLDPYDDEHQPGEKPPHGCSLEELRARFEGGGGFEIVESLVPERAYPGREGREMLVRMRKL
ncbi:MAG: methyltransferase domain-containing protein [Akkermansiaceae bacterium]|nr:methyltransferase domain-containing protein [Akkermansiaceae bacterium]